MSEVELPDHAHPSQLNRRHFLAGGMATAGALALAQPLLALAKQASPVAATDAQIKLLTELGELTIPTTTTPGAGSLETARFVALGVAHQLFNAPLDAIGRLQAHLDSQAGRDFLSLPPPARLALLQQVDELAYRASAESDETGWRAVKRLIVFAYYTSQVGASEELRFEPVPGRFDPDVILTKDSRAVSNDSLGNGFT